MIKYNWYALYTRSRFEKKIAGGLRDQGIEVYLPLVTAYRRWSDRTKKIQVPLFNSYVFVKSNPLDHKHFHTVIQTPGVVKVVCFEGKPVQIPDNQIEALKRFEELGYEMSPIGYKLETGSLVEIRHGILKGLRGMVLKVDNNQMLIIHVDALDKNVQIKIPAGFTIKMNPCNDSGHKKNRQVEKFI
ncbi:MAG TPA: UpxY family transcription antiterminator [Bacteroidales bacterium]|nr:UpxY family transcription antiterminator [Bacteroidales bacterium]